MSEQNRNATMPIWNPRATLAGLLAAAFILIALPAAAAVDYVKEVKPILAEHCYRCHGSSQQKGDLRVDTAAFSLKGGESGPGLKPGKSAESLFIQAMKGTHEDISQMPYKKPALPEKQIDLVAKWIDEGAKAPADEEPEKNLHWAFIPPERPPVPKLSSASKNSVHPIDAFIRQRLEKEKITPSEEADRTTLLRRLSLDLTGLPPSPAEVQAFLEDKSPGAYESAVERLLKSPHYGERWGRWWLDAARYADSNGYSIDSPRSIWKYRDWVVNALNKDVPFDQFAVEQLAGDLLPKATIDQKIATGFNRNTQVNQEGGIDPEQFRVESVMDRVNTFSTVFLGLTVACAQCHDHKFDPISQREYYQLYAFFNNTAEDGHGKGAASGMLEIPGETEPIDALLKELEESQADLERYLDTKGSEVTGWEEKLNDEDKAKLKRAVLATVGKSWRERKLNEKRASYAAFKPDDADFKSRNTKVTRLEKKEPKAVTTLVMQELPKPRPATIFIKGDFTRPGDKVAPGVLTSMHPLSVKDTNTALTRLDLARWLGDPTNALTARVMANRIWQQYFGRGLVETENDFGTQGSLPTHPELLDWLAVELRTPTYLPAAQKESKPQPWSLKHLHRVIVTSATYKQSSKARSDLDLVDSQNHFLARQSRFRLDAELVRDAALSASGLLSTSLGGPPVYPPQPNGVMTLGQVKRDWKASSGTERHRRALYTHLWRATPHPALAVFDAPDGLSACTRRLRSNTPLQALTLLNDQQFYEFAQALAQRVLKEVPEDESQRIDRLFRLCLSREPLPTEKERLQTLLSTEKQLRKNDQDRVWVTLARVVLNLDETITRE